MIEEKYNSSQELQDVEMGLFWEDLLSYNFKRSAMKLKWRYRLPKITYFR